MRGNITLKILEGIIETGGELLDFFSYFFSDYHTSYRRLRGLGSNSQRKIITPEEIADRERHRFYDLLAKLKKDDLIVKSKNGKWMVTERGLARRDLILGRRESALPEAKYEITEATEWKIVIFDIPERERRKRFWLRHALKRLKFKMLQKSVWIGKVKLPEEFMHDLRRLRLLSYVEILAITKSGSLRHLQ